MNYINNFFSKVTTFVAHAFEKKVHFTNGTPRILITPEAYKDMYQIVNLVDTEVGWIGNVSRLGNDFLIQEVFLPEQEVHATTTEISSGGLAIWATEMLLARADGLEVINGIRFWGHSHVQMGTSPSWQDDSQMRIFAESCDDYFIRGILNKLGRMEFTLYLFNIGIEIHDVEWSIYSPEEDQARKEKWLAEIAGKVREIIPAYTGFDYPAKTTLKKKIGRGRL